MNEHRPIEHSDFERAMAVMHALDMVREEPQTAAWEHLVFLHEQRVSEDARVSTDELAGDSAFNAERTRALVLLERLTRGETTVPITVGPLRARCSTPGCVNTTMSVLCPSCELELGS